MVVCWKSFMFHALTKKHNFVLFSASILSIQIICIVLISSLPFRSFISRMFHFLWSNVLFARDEKWSYMRAPFCSSQTWWKIWFSLKSSSLWYFSLTYPHKKYYHDTHDIERMTIKKASEAVEGCIKEIIYISIESRNRRPILNFL